MRALLLVALLAWTARAERVARDTADIGPKGSWSVGVFYPLRVALLDRLELQTHPALFFVAPNVTARVGLLQGTPVRVAGEVSLALPTPVLRLTQGYLFPSWSEGRDRIGWMVTPRLAVLATYGKPTGHVVTAIADATVRVPFERTNATRLDSFLAPLDSVLAAPLTGFVTRLGVAGDVALGDLVRARLELNVHVTGTRQRLLVGDADVGALANLSPWYFTGHLGVDIAIGKQSRLTVGLYYANYDQGARVDVRGSDGFWERRRVRLNNILPTIDFVWSGGP